MHRVCLETFGQFLTNRACIGVRRVRRAHDVTVALHRVFALEHLHNNRAGDHEPHEVSEERTFAVDSVKALGLLLGHLDALRSHDAQSGIFKHFGDGTSQVAARCVGLDDRESTCRGHDGRGSI